MLTGNLDLGIWRDNKFFFVIWHSKSKRHGRKILSEFKDQRQMETSESIDEQQKLSKL